MPQRHGIHSVAIAVRKVAGAVGVFPDGTGPAVGVLNVVAAVVVATGYRTVFRDERLAPIRARVQRAVLRHETGAAIGVGDQGATLGGFNGAAISTFDSTSGRHGGRIRPCIMFVGSPGTRPVFADLACAFALSHTFAATFRSTGRAEHATGSSRVRTTVLAHLGCLGVGLLRLGCVLFLPTRWPVTVAIIPDNELVNRLGRSLVDGFDGDGAHFHQRDRQRDRQQRGHPREDDDNRSPQGAGVVEKTFHESGSLLTHAFQQPSH